MINKNGKLVHFFQIPLNTLTFILSVVVALNVLYKSLAFSIPKCLGQYLPGVLLLQGIWQFEGIYSAFWANTGIY